MKKFIYIVLTLCFVSFNIFSLDDESQKPQQFNTTTSAIAITIASQYPDYPATPGDIYSIDFLTGANINQTLTAYVDTNYNIDLSFIGKVNVKGLIYSETQQVLKDTILAAYPGSIVNVIIASSGKFSVTILGEVSTAQIVDAYSITTLAQVINGKTTKYASFRDIEIRSEDGTMAVYDLFQFTRYANKKHNPYLRPNDVITIRPYKKAVTISGEVKRPGVYQLLEDETLYDLINIQAEGFTKIADTKHVELQRIINGDDEFSDGIDYLNCETRDLTLVKLSDFDKLTVSSSIKMPRIVIQGAITPAKYKMAADGTRILDTSSVETELGTSVSNRLTVSFVTGSKLSTILSEIDGTFNLSSSIEDAFILRGKENINVNLMMLGGPNNGNDVVMMDGDILVIPFKQQIVYVAGSANSKGAKPFIANRTADYYIGLAGGFNRIENIGGAYVIHDVYGNKRPKNSIIQPEDVIWVRRNHPMSYVTEYSGWITTIVSVAILAFELDAYYDYLP